MIQFASMTKSKKYFLFGAIIITIILISIAIDISRKTIPPWRKNQMEQPDMGKNDDDISQMNLKKEKITNFPGLY